MASTRSLIGVGFIVSTALLAGCNSGDKRYAVSGDVTYKGQPIKNGIISFVLKGTQASAGGSPIVDGKYEVPANPGLAPGEYEVIISVPTAAPAKVASGEEGPGEGGEKDTRETLPAKYNSMTQLKAEVKAGQTNRFDFHLQ